MTIDEKEKAPVRKTLTNFLWGMILCCLLIIVCGVAAFCFYVNLNELQAVHCLHNHEKPLTEVLFVSLKDPVTRSYFIHGMNIRESYRYKDELDYVIMIQARSEYFKSSELLRLMDYPNDRVRLKALTLVIDETRRVQASQLFGRLPLGFYHYKRALKAIKSKRAEIYQEILQHEIATNQNSEQRDYCLRLAKLNKNSANQ